VEVPADVQPADSDVTERHVVAIGGGGLSADAPVLEEYIRDLVDSPRPKVCFIPTASGDDAGYALTFFEVFTSLGCVPSVLRLFGREVGDLAGFVGDHDIVYVGGGNTANMLAIWRRHGLDVVLQDAWARGVVVCGVSAGANCWFEASTTDSFGLGRADPLADGLGLVAGSFCPHYDAEPARRPAFIDLVTSGALPPGHACDDGAAVHFAGGELASAVAARSGATAYRIDEQGIEHSLSMRTLA
jgi:peptidase E